MNRTQLLQEILNMRFPKVYEEWSKGRLTQEEAARAIGVCDRTFRRYMVGYKADGMDGLIDMRINQVSHRRAPVSEVTQLLDLYIRRYSNWNVKHFYEYYTRDHQGQRSYTWVKRTLQDAGLVAKGKLKNIHRKKRERAAMKGMMLHQDGSQHAWVKHALWDLIITFDDADSEHYSMFFVDEEGTDSSFLGVKETIEGHGLFCSLYTDRGSHYWHTPTADGPVDKDNHTQFGRAMQQLGVEMIPAYSPEARGRCERQFLTHQGRLPHELALEGIIEMPRANQYLKEVYMPRFNQTFMVKALCEESAFVDWHNSVLLDDILCEQTERTVSKDNCVAYKRLSLQIPQDKYRHHYVKAKVRVHRYISGELAVFHGPRKLATYSHDGKAISQEMIRKAA